MSEIIDFETHGTCCSRIIVEIEDDKIKNISFLGGCQGNLAGIKNLVIGEDIKIVKDKLKGILCGSKLTSCPDQLALCLEEYINQKSVQKV